MGILEIFGKKTVDDSNIHDILKASFTNVRQDTDLLFQWINFLNQKIQQQEQVIYNLRVEVSSIPKTK